jgi:hypothetical protein
MMLPACHEASGCSKEDLSQSKLQQRAMKIGNGYNMEVGGYGHYLEESGNGHYVEGSCNGNYVEESGNSHYAEGSGNDNDVEESGNGHYMWRNAASYTSEYLTLKNCIAFLRNKPYFVNVGGGPVASRQHGYQDFGRNHPCEGGTVEVEA